MILKYNIRTRANTLPTALESIGSIKTKFPNLIYKEICILVNIP